MGPRLLVEKQTEYGRRRPKRKMYFCRCSANVLFSSGPFQQSQTMINLNNSIMKLLTGGFCRKTRYFSFVTFAYMRNVWRSHRYIQTKNKRHIYLLVVAFVLLQLRAATVLMQFCVTLNCFVCCFAFLLYQSPRPHELLCTHVMSIVKMWFMNSKQKHTATVCAIFFSFFENDKRLVSLFRLPFFTLFSYFFSYFGLSFFLSFFSSCVYAKCFCVTCFS